jgi:hypothetical protein
MAPRGTGDKPDGGQCRTTVGHPQRLILLERTLAKRATASDVQRLHLVWMLWISVWISMKVALILSYSWVRKHVSRASRVNAARQRCMEEYVQTVPRTVEKRRYRETHSEAEIHGLSNTKQAKTHTIPKPAKRPNGRLCYKPRNATSKTPLGFALRSDTTLTMNK